MLVFHLENKMPQLCKEKKLIWLLRAKVIVESQIIKNSFPISGKWILICSWYNHHLSKNQFGNVSYKQKIAGNISILYDTVPYAWIHNTSLSRVWNFLYLSQRTWLFFLLSGALIGVWQAFRLHEFQWQCNTDSLIVGVFISKVLIKYLWKTMKLYFLQGWIWVHLYKMYVSLLYCR